MPYGHNFAARVLDERYKIVNDDRDSQETVDLLQREADDDNNGKSRMNMCVLKGDGLCVVGNVPSHGRQNP